MTASNNTMKIAIHLQLLIILTWLLGSNEVRSAEFVIGLSPSYTAAQQAEVKRALLSFLLERAPAGDRVACWDAWNLTSIAFMEVPALKAHNIRARAMRMPQISALTQWFNRLTNAAVPPELRGTASLRTPEWLQLVTGQPVVGRRVILLVGSPIYINQSEPTFSMTEGRYPSDGHLACTLTESVFGLAEKKGRLSGTHVHWCYVAEQLWENELHRAAVTRFWGLFAAGQGGMLATFQADLTTALGNALNASLGPCGQFQIDPADTKPLMRAARPRLIPAWLQTPETEHGVSASPPPQNQNRHLTNATANEVSAQVGASLIAEPLAAPARKLAPATAPDDGAPRPIGSPAPASTRQLPIAAPGKPESAPPPQRSTRPTPQPPAAANLFPIQAATGKTGIGIMWDAEGVDLDLYVKAHTSASELFYRQTITREGRYFFDYRNRNSNLDYEYVELRNPVDLVRLQVWVNYYKGNAPAPKGKVCLHYGAKTYHGTFSISASRGNHGGDANGRASSPYWSEIPLRKIMGLESTANSTLSP